MYPLPIPLLLPIENRVFIPRHHLPLGWHFRPPSRDGFGHEALLRETAFYGRDHVVDYAEACFGLRR